MIPERETAFVNRNSIDSGKLLSIPRYYKKKQKKKKHIDEYPSERQFEQHNNNCDESAR